MWCGEFRQTAPPEPNREIVAHGFFPLDALPPDTTKGTRARIAEVLNGTRAAAALVAHGRVVTADLRRYAG